MRVDHHSCRARANLNFDCATDNSHHHLRSLLPSTSQHNPPDMNNPNFSSSAYTDSAYLGNLPQNPQASNATNPNTAGGLGSSQYATPSNEKVQRFNSWHSKQGIATPQDYPNYASQPDPFSTVPRNPLLPTAASPYLQKVGGLPSGRPADSLVRRTIPIHTRSLENTFTNGWWKAEWKRG